MSHKFSNLMRPLKVRGILRNVLKTLCESADTDGFSFAGNEYIAHCAGWSRSKVISRLGKLRAVGIVSVEQRHGRSTVRRVNADRIKELIEGNVDVNKLCGERPEADEGVPEGDGSPVPEGDGSQDSAADEPVPEGDGGVPVGDGGCPRGGQGCPPGGHIISTQTSLNHQRDIKALSTFSPASPPKKSTSPPVSRNGKARHGIDPEDLCWESWRAFREEIPGSRRAAYILAYVAHRTGTIADPTAENIEAAQNLLTFFQFHKHPLDVIRERIDEIVERIGDDESRTLPLAVLLERVTLPEPSPDHHEETPKCQASSPPARDGFASPTNPRSTGPASPTST